MTGGTQSLKHRRAASLLAAGAVGAVLLAGATACASTAKSVSVSAGGSYSGSPTASATASASPSATASGSASASASASGGTGLATAPGVGITPNAQLSTAPAGTKYTPFLTAAHSADGRTLYLALVSQGGACGRYDVVLQQSSGAVSVGLVHLSSSGRICPMYMTRVLIPTKLSAPLDGRRVVDLANGQTVGSAQIG